MTIDRRLVLMAAASLSSGAALAAQPSDMVPQGGLNSSQPFTNSNGGANARSLATRFGLIYDVNDFRLPADSDDSNAILKAATAAWTNQGVLYFPARGSAYNYSGPGIAWGTGHLYLRGDGREVSKININSNAYFIDTLSGINNACVSDLTFSGGLGAFRSKYTGMNDNPAKEFRSCNFLAYTQCAVQWNGSDEYNYVFYNCWFQAASSVATMGIAAGSKGTFYVLACNFVENQIHIKARSGGVSAFIGAGTEFIQSEAGSSSSPRAAIWLVPDASTSSPCGRGLTVSARMSNENQQSQDYKIIYADEGAGTWNGDMPPNLTMASAGYIQGHRYIDCEMNNSGANPAPFIYSMTPNVSNTTIANCGFWSPMSYLIEFFSGVWPLVPNKSNQGNIFGPNQFLGTPTAYAPIAVSNAAGVGMIIDPNGVYGGTQAMPVVGAQGSGLGGKMLFSSYNSYTWTSGTTGQVAVGGGDGWTDAQSATILAGGGLACSLTAANINIGEPGWIEFALGPSGATPVTQILAQIVDSASAIHWASLVTVPSSGWKFFRFPWTPRSQPTGMTLQLFNNTGSAGGIEIGNVRVYQQRSPGLYGQQNFDTLSVTHGFHMNTVTFANLPNASKYQNYVFLVSDRIATWGGLATSDGTNWRVVGTGAVAS